MILNRYLQILCTWYKISWWNTAPHRFLNHPKVLIWLPQLLALSKAEIAAEREEFQTVNKGQENARRQLTVIPKEDFAGYFKKWKRSRRGKCMKSQGEYLKGTKACLCYVSIFLKILHRYFPERFSIPNKYLLNIIIPLLTLSLIHISSYQAVPGTRKIKHWRV